MKRFFKCLVHVVFFPLALVVWVILYVRNVVFYFVYRIYRAHKAKGVLMAHGPIAAALYKSQTLIQLKRFTRG